MLRRTLLRVLLLAAVVAGTFLLPYWWLDTHQLMPTLKGCSFVRDDQSRRACYGDEMIQAIEGQSLTDSISTLASLDDSATTSFQQDCHLGAHRVAWWFLKHNAKADAELRTADFSDDSECVAGFMHGLVERQVQLSPTAFGSLARGMCGQMDTELQSRNCYHGLGHGAYLTDPQPTKARERCLGLPEEGRRDCMTGLYMQRAFKVDEQEAPTSCDDVPRDDVISCWQYVLMPLEEINEPAEIVAFCKAQDLRGDALKGCVMQMQGTKEHLKFCKDYDSQIARSHCAYSVVANPIKAPTKAWITDNCDGSSPVDYGCAAGYGVYVRREAPAKRAEQDAAEACAALGRDDLQQACMAGARDCFPEIVRYQDSPPTCPSDRRIPA